MENTKSFLQQTKTGKKVFFSTYYETCGYMHMALFVFVLYAKTVRII